jgi:uncharacterized protein YqeY
MSLSEQVNEDMKTAMRAGEKLRLETLRSLRASMLELQKSGKEVSADDELKAVMNQAKRRKDAAEQYRNASRADLAEKEEAELKIIEAYLPKQMSDDEIRDGVRAIISEVGAKGPDDFKNVMPKAMGAMRGKADGGKVQAIVKEELQNT